MYFYRTVINKNEIDTFNNDVVLSFDRDNGIKIFKEGLIKKIDDLELECQQPTTLKGQGLGMKIPSLFFESSITQSSGECDG